MMSTNRHWLNNRYSGVLAHISSLPSEFGIGNLGKGAKDFIDFLSDHRFTFWQICPVGPTGYGDSPYQSFSSFAGNPYFIDLDALQKQGLVKEEWIQSLRTLPEAEVDFGELYRRFWGILALVKDSFDAHPVQIGDRSFERFVAEEADWLDPYSLFMALKHHHNGQPWHLWSDEWRTWSRAKEWRIEGSIADERERQRFYQYCFYQQWRELRSYAHERNVQIIGDLPIFVSYDSADCWRNPELFTLDEDGQQLTVAGVPPDYFSNLGQLWGNPLYDWELHKGSGYSWWLKRIERSFRIYDVIRLDHFRGFDSYWSIPAGAKDARTGEWLRAPGQDFFKVLSMSLPHAKLIAEDLGYITEDVYRLRIQTGFPGMKILQFGFGHDENQVNLPHCYERNSVVYTGTHDNETSRAWLSSLRGEQKTRVRSYFDTDDSHSAWPLIRAAFSCVSNLAVIPLQDLLDLPAYARFNHPGTASGNWKWRFKKEQLDRLIEKRGEQILYWQYLYGRDGKPGNRDFSETPEDLHGNLDFSHANDN